MRDTKFLPLGDHDDGGSFVAVFILGLVLFVLISIFQGISDNALTMLMVAIVFPLSGFLVHDRLGLTSSAQGDGPTGEAAVAPR